MPVFSIQIFGCFNKQIPKYLTRNMTEFQQRLPYFEPYLTVLDMNYCLYHNISPYKHHSTGLLAPNMQQTR